MSFPNNYGQQTYRRQVVIGGQTHGERTALPVESEPAAEYSREYYEARPSPTFRVEMRELIALADVQPNDAVLELGCGGGQFLAACVPRRPSLLLGSDLNREAMNLSRQTAPAATLAIADATRLPFGDAIFDVIVAQHLIEHFDSRDELLLEWGRVLRPSGRIVVVTPNARYLDTALFDDPTHRHIYNSRALSRLFTRNGFSVERCYTLMPYLGHRRLSRALAKWATPALLALRFVPWFRDKGLALFLKARKYGTPEGGEGRTG